MTCVGDSCVRIDYNVFLKRRRRGDVLGDEGRRGRGRDRGVGDDGLQRVHVGANLASTVVGEVARVGEMRFHGVAYLAPRRAGDDEPIAKGLGTGRVRSSVARGFHEASPPAAFEDDAREIGVFEDSDDGVPGEMTNDFDDEFVAVRAERCVGGETID